MFVQSFKILRQVAPEKYLTEYVREKEKWTNKGTDKQYVAVFFFVVAQYNPSLISFVLNFRILSQVVAEKSLTEKKFTNRQT